MSLLLDLIGKDYPLKGGGRWWRVDGEPSSLIIDAERDVFYWNSQNLYGDAYVWLKYKGYSHSEIKEIIRNSKITESSFINTIKSDSGEEVIVYPKLVDIFHSNGWDNRDYWYKRLIKDETIDRFMLGYYDGWYTIPIYQDGMFVNFQCRRDEPEKAIRVWYRNTKPTLFNSEILRVTNSIVISEGLTDCLMLNQLGIPSVSQTGGAGYWNLSWYKYFIHQKSIYIVYDNDKAGEEGSYRVANMLGMYKCKILTFSGEEKGYDVCKFVKDNYIKMNENISKVLYNKIINESQYAFLKGKKNGNQNSVFR